MYKLEMEQQHALNKRSIRNVVSGVNRHKLSPARYNISRSKGRTTLGNVAVRSTSVHVCLIQRATTNELTAKALTVRLAGGGAHYALQGVVEDHTAHLVMRDCFAAKTFLFNATDLAIAFAANAIRKIKVGASKGTATHIKSFPKVIPIVNMIFITI